MQTLVTIFFPFLDPRRNGISVIGCLKTPSRKPF
jgi:hypothetical protein